MTTNKTVPNRLSKEKSPYLLQHAYNPVDWYPWGDEAFAKAKAEDKPIFLSIGYSTCHWCHVMERESFEDSEVAALMNKYFVAVKVDREERPDIDQIYMTVCQIMTGRGGWPLTVIMTPDRKPFFTGTYFPKNNGMGVNGLLTILEKVRLAWAVNRQDLIDSGNQITSAINQEKIGREDFKPNLVAEAFSQFKSDFDYLYGGFGDHPKFPSPHNLCFLLRYWSITKDPSALEMVEKTLDAMYNGGLFDHIGYGFSRYSTDRKWLVPHFEKMLYDNALLAIAYLETYQATKKPGYAAIARQIFAYILRDMTSSEGGFYSAEDADSEGEEGKFYVWTVDEIKHVLGDGDGSIFCAHYSITHQGNFDGKNIPNLLNPSSSAMDTELIEGCKNKLFDYREKRIHPYKDDKILTAWNGLMIAALAIGGRVLGEKLYTSASEKAAAFIFKNLMRKDGRLLARYRDGDAAFPAYLDDYAFLIWGLIELYETTFQPEYLEKAINLNSDLIKYFGDHQQVGFFVYGNDGEQLITRPKEIYDGATPSGNSVSALNILRLARLTGNSALEDNARQLLKAFASSINQYPKGYAFSLMAILLMQSTSTEIVIAADRMNDEAKQMLDIIYEKFRPFAVTILYSRESRHIEKTIPFIANYLAIDGKPTAYLCENRSCQAPVTDPDLFKQMLQDKD